MTEPDLRTFTATFETDEGMAFTAFEASNIRVATKMLKATFPDDIGADGFWTDEDGTEYPINW
jgi:hypothetical protein